MARLLICVCLWLFLLPLNVRADVGRWEEACDKFNWNPNAELDLAGYKGLPVLIGMGDGILRSQPMTRLGMKVPMQTL
jgi:hypothetical protein